MYTVHIKWKQQLLILFSTIIMLSMDGTWFHTAFVACNIITFNWIDFTLRKGDACQRVRMFVWLCVFDGWVYTFITIVFVKKNLFLSRRQLWFSETFSRLAILYTIRCVMNAWDLESNNNKDKKQKNKNC